VSLHETLQQRLQERRKAGLYRSPRVVERRGGVEAILDGRRYRVFCSNDYLGLAADPRLAEALSAAAVRCGVGSGAAHLISGHSPEHEALERALAEHTGRDRAVLFSTGYMANLGVIDALAGRGDRVLEDRLNHASLLDGARLAGARLIRYRHGDMADLSRRLEAGRDGRTLVVTDGVFSMDGDVAPLTEAAAVAAAHEAWLMVDDAHGLGVLGPGGAGSVAAAGLSQAQVPVLMGTLGKALGTFGAFVAGSETLVETLIQDARTYVYTTATPPPLAAATRRALAIAREEGWRRTHLQSLIARFRREAAGLGLEPMPSETPIQPLLIGDAQAATAAADRLAERGILVTAIRPPTVPKGAARLRITFSAVHSEQDLDCLLDALQSLPRPGAP